MDLVKLLRKSIYLSETFGLVSFKITESNGVNMFTETEHKQKMTKIHFGSVLALHFALVIFTTEEIYVGKEDVCVKIVRYANLLAFSGGIVAMFLVITTKGTLLCAGLNQMHNAYVCLTLGKCRCNGLKGSGTLFLGTIANYSATVLPLMLTALYVQRNKVSKVITYSYYAYSMWLENVFIYQFVTMAKYIGEVYGTVTRSSLQSGMTYGKIVSELRKSRSREQMVKNFVRVFAASYKYAVFFWICWSFTMILQFVLKVNLRIRVLIWCFFISVRVITIIHGCNIIKTEVEKTARKVLELFIGIDVPEIKEEVTLFPLNMIALSEITERWLRWLPIIPVLFSYFQVEIYIYQLLHRKPDFDVFGFFTLNFPLFRSMVSSLATYIVILTQLKDSSETFNIKSNRTSSKLYG